MNVYYEDLIDKINKGLNINSLDPDVKKKVMQYSYKVATNEELSFYKIKE